MEFFTHKRITLYSQIKIEHISDYPEWRNSNRRDGRKGGASADTVNKELNRLNAIIRYGVKFCGWQERYLIKIIKRGRL